MYVCVNCVYGQSAQHAVADNHVTICLSGMIFCVWSGSLNVAHLLGWSVDETPAMLQSTDLAPLLLCVVQLYGMLLIFCNDAPDFECVLVGWWWHFHWNFACLRSGFSTANQTPMSLIADQHGKMISDQARRCFSIANQCLIVDQISRQFDSPLFASELVDCRSTMADVQSFFNFSTL